jgi:hypothetical protein
MSDEDHAATEMLAAEMSDYADACRFLRSQSGLGLRDCSYWLEKIASKFPASPAADAVQRWNARACRNRSSQSI